MKIPRENTRKNVLAAGRRRLVKREQQSRPENVLDAARRAAQKKEQERK